MNARFRVPLALVLGAASTAAAQETVDLAVVHRIKAEAFQSGKVMDHLFFLTDVGGPRLTASPGQRAAADWAIARLKSWGIDSARSEPWGRFGRSWQLKRFAAHQLTPTYAPLHGVPLAWSGGTRGPVTADVVLAPVFERFEDSLRADPARVAARVQEYAQQKRGKLAGRIVLIEPLRELPPATAAALSRFDDADLAKLAAAPEPEPLPPLEWPVTKLPDDPKERQRVLSTLPLEAAEDYWTRQTRAWDPLWTFLREEGVPAVLVNDAYGRDAGGTLFAEQAGFWRAGSPVPPPVVVLAAESYGRIARLAQQQHPVRLELEVAVEMQEEDRDAANVIAEIPGGTRADEVVMLGAHLDSWHSGTGATDNAAGCAVILEAMRILKALELPLARTVRLALWTGEEQGIYGSRAYVKTHFADPVTMRREPEHEKLAAYFNVDNGTGKIRGVYLQGNANIKPLFESWLSPFGEAGAKTLTLQNTGGTDHLPFDAIGLPGFQFIQDPAEYDTRTHHSNQDNFDRIQPEDMKQASTILAAFVYQAAMMDGKLPRKTLIP